MLEGITAGFILSLSLFPGAVWLAKVGVCGTKSQVIAVGSAFASAQLLWLIAAIPGLMVMVANLHFILFAMHWFAAFVLGYIAVKFIRSRRASVLGDVDRLPGAVVLFREAFSLSLAMPMRLPAAMAVLLATGVYINNPPVWSTVPKVCIGALIGVCWWWGQLSFLAAFFAKRVPEHITLKSLNKIRPLCALLYLVLLGVVLFLGG